MITWTQVLVKTNLIRTLGFSDCAQMLGNEFFSLFVKRQTQTENQNLKLEIHYVFESNMKFANIIRNSINIPTWSWPFEICTQKPDIS